MFVLTHINFGTRFSALVGVYSTFECALDKIKDNCNVESYDRITPDKVRFHIDAHTAYDVEEFTVGLYSSIGRARIF